MTSKARITLIVLFFLCISIDNARSQPGKFSNAEYFNQFIQTNEDRVSAYENIQKLRSKLSDTLFVEKSGRDTLWLKKHREALYLNFLCYDFASGLTGNDLCLKQKGLQNFQLFYQFKDLKGFPSTSQYESKYEEVKHVQKLVCLNIYIQNNSDFKQIPETACGCQQVIEEMKDEQDELLRVAGLQEKKAIEAKKNHRQQEIQDSITRWNERIRYEPIYFSNGVLRADSSFRVISSDIDSLNIFLINQMLNASREVFSFNVNNCASENIEMMLLDVQSQKNAPFYRLVKLRKINGVLTLIEHVPLNSIANKTLLELVSELYLTDVARFVQENELLVLPFKFSRNHTHTDNRTVEHKIENGFLHIILPVISHNLKDDLPKISPEEWENRPYEPKPRN